jgi:ketopantoate reductase
MTHVVVFGASGRIGSLLCSMTRGTARPVAVTRISDDFGVDRPLDNDAAPIVVCTRNDDLDAVLERVHPSRHRHLVFVQNGTIRHWLAERGLADNGRGVLWVAVTHRGAEPVPGGPSVFTGPWASLIAEMMHGHGVDAQAVDAVAFAREEAVKLTWICATGVIGSATGHGVEGIDAHHAADLEALVRELHPVMQHSPGLDLSADQLVARIQSYSARIPHFPARMKEWAWRNGAVVHTARSAGIPTPLHDAWIQRAKA